MGIMGMMDVNELEDNERCARCGGALDGWASADWWCRSCVAQERDRGIE